MTVQIMDMNAALGHVISQRTHIETVVLKKKYPQIRYAELIPVDTSAHKFAASTTFYSQDSVGRAKFINGKADDVPLVDIQSSKFEQTVNMAGIGYSFSLEEIGAAQQLGQNLSADGAHAARQAYEQFVDEVSFTGGPQEGVEGLFNMTGISKSSVSKKFGVSTSQEILTMINNAFSKVTEDAGGFELPDTLILPSSVYSMIATKQLALESETTVLKFLTGANLYTVTTGQPLKIVGSHRLKNRMVVYRRDPSVLKLHMPMPLEFIAPQVDNFNIKTLGMFRFSTLNIRNPRAVHYVDGIA